MNYKKRHRWSRYNPFPWSRPFYHILWNIDDQLHREIRTKRLLTGEYQEMGRFHAKICNMIERDLAKRVSE